MGFADPGRTSSAIRAWHHGRIAATRTERGRELFTRLAPRLLEAAQATGAPDAAFSRFSDFFGRVSSGVQLQSLFLAQPRLLERWCGSCLRAAVRPHPGPPAGGRSTPCSTRPSSRRWRRRSTCPPPWAGRRGSRRRWTWPGGPAASAPFGSGVQVLGGVAGAEAAGPAFADLADALIGGLAADALAEVERAAGPFPGEVAVIALGKCGSREMTVRSDLDLMTLYRPARPNGVSRTKAWSAATFYTRFTQRLVAAPLGPDGGGRTLRRRHAAAPVGHQRPGRGQLRGLSPTNYAGEAGDLGVPRPEPGRGWCGPARPRWRRTRRRRWRRPCAGRARPPTTARDVADMRA